MVSSAHQMVRAAAQNKLYLIRNDRGGGSFTSDEIRNEVSRMVEVFDVGEAVDRDALVAELEESFQTIIGISRVLRGDDDAYEPWLAARKAERWPFWDRYEQYLLQKTGWPHATLDRLDESTDLVLDLFTDPKRAGSWDRRGLVVGHVQSGKTSHYTGLICKAADVGYKLIIVLAGFHKSLRSQTQIRLEEGFLGYDRGECLKDGSAALIPVGVGKIDPNPRADSITTRADDGDFKKAVAKHFGIKPGGNPLLFVVKKNGSVLRNLLSWVESVTQTKDDQGMPYVREVPLLVVDDEADQGSIDTRAGAVDVEGDPDEDHDPTVLNQRIRGLLNLFEQSAYVGYTATPFANIFIHGEGQTRAEGEDLFPRSFIVALPTPSNYVGPVTIFGRENDDGSYRPGLPIVHQVTDQADTLDIRESSGWMPPRHNKLHIPLHENQDELPPSLSRAIRSFVLVCAARKARGKGTEHNSMLVHVTRFTAVQARVAGQVRAELGELKRRLKYGDRGSPSQLREELEELWEDDFAQASEEIVALFGERAGTSHAWSEIEPYLEGPLRSIQVREINGLAGEVLDYVRHEESGLNVIAIGGDKLSRGLTLEGLSVSYFLRATRMYDTLMQMGRWFGYRPGYLDLCRLYTTPEMEDWFFHIAQASEELREDFNRMVASGGTPREFGHRVRSHPLMLVTSQVKMRHGSTIHVSFEGDISETINFWRTRSRLEENWRAAKRLVEKAEREGHVPTKTKKDTGPWVWSGVRPEGILDFLAEYREHTASKKVKTKLLADYIRQEILVDRLTEWRILLAGGSGGPVELGAASSSLVERAWHLSTRDKAEEKKQYIRRGHFRIRRLVSPADEAVDLGREQQKEALRLTREDWELDPRGRKKPTRPGGREIRQVRNQKRGLLLLYPIDGTGEEKVEADATDIPLLGFAISFPHVPSSEASRVAYVVNNVYWQQEFLEPNGGDSD